MKQVKKSAAPVVVESKLSIAAQEVAALRDLTAKQLVAKAKKEFGQHLNLDNGKSWLLKKVGYLIQERYVGLNETTAHRAEELNRKEKIEEMKAEDAKKELLAAAKHKDKPAKAKKEGADNKERNDLGIVLGSRREHIYKMLKNGCSMIALRAEKDGMIIKKWLEKEKNCKIVGNDDRLHIA